MNTLPKVGQRVWHRGSKATVLRVTQYGDITIQSDVDPVPITTRACFLELVV